MRTSVCDDEKYRHSHKEDFLVKKKKRMSALRLENEGRNEYSWILTRKKYQKNQHPPKKKNQPTSVWAVETTAYSE